MQDTNKEYAELLARIIIVERQVIELEKNKENLLNQFSELLKKIDIIKDDIRSYKDIPIIQEKIDNLNIALNNIKLENSDFRLVKRIVFGLIGFILIAFLSLIWQSSITQHPNNEQTINEITKKLIDEYKKSEKQ